MLRTEMAKSVLLWTVSKATSASAEMTNYRRLDLLRKGESVCSTVALRYDQTCRFIIMLSDPPTGMALHESPMRRLGRLHCAMHIAHVGAHKLQIVMAGRCVTLRISTFDVCAYNNYLKHMRDTCVCCVGLHTKHDFCRCPNGTSFVQIRC